MMGDGEIYQYPQYVWSPAPTDNNSKIKCKYDVPNHSSSQSEAMVGGAKYDFPWSRAPTDGSDNPKKKLKCKFDGCGHTAAKGADMNRHYQTKVHQEPQVRCEIEGCSVMFTRRDAAKRHMMNVHFVEFPGTPTRKATNNLKKKDAQAGQEVKASKKKNTQANKKRRAMKKTKSTN